MLNNFVVLDIVEIILLFLVVIFFIRIKRIQDWLNVKKKSMNYKDYLQKINDILPVRLINIHTISGRILSLSFIIMLLFFLFLEDQQNLYDIFILIFIFLAFFRIIFSIINIMLIKRNYNNLIQGSQSI